MYVPGTRASFEILKHPKHYLKILNVFVDLKNIDLIEELKTYADIKSRVFAKDRAFLDKLAPHNQGLILEINYQPGVETDLETHLRVEQPKIILMLDQITDPHNLGACIRSAEVLAGATIILPKDGSAPLNDTVAKTSAGALFHSPIFIVNNLNRVMDNLQKQGYWSYVADGNSQGNSLYELKFTFPVIIIIGSEEKGVRRLLKDKADFDFFIPMQGKVESLNLSVATAITMYELSRQMGK